MSARGPAIPREEPDSAPSLPRAERSGPAPAPARAAVAPAAVVSRAAVAPTAAALAPAAPAPQSDDEAPPRLVYTEDEDEEEHAATMLHRNAKAPDAKPAEAREEHTAPLPPHVVAAARDASNARADALRTADIVLSPLGSASQAPDSTNATNATNAPTNASDPRESISLLPLAVGGLLFVAGLLAYLLVR